MSTLVCSPWSVSLGQYTSCHPHFYPFHLEWTRSSSRCRSPDAQTELHVLCQWPQNWRSWCCQFCRWKEHYAWCRNVAEIHPTHTLQLHSVMDFLCRTQYPLGHVDTTLPESTIGGSSRHPTAKSTSPVDWSNFSWVPTNSSLTSETLVDELGNSVESNITLLHFWTQNTYAVRSDQGVSKSSFSWTSPTNSTLRRFITEITQRALSIIFIRRSSLVLVVVPFSWMFSLAIAFTFTFAFGWLWPCPFSDVFDHSRMSLCNGSWDGLLFMYSCLNQHWASSWPIRQHHLQYPPNFRCSPRSGWNPSPLCIFPLPLVPLHFPKFYGTPVGFHLSQGLYQLEHAQVMCMLRVSLFML